MNVTFLIATEDGWGSTELLAVFADADRAMELCDRLKAVLAPYQAGVRNGTVSEIDRQTRGQVQDSCNAVWAGAGNFDLTEVVFSVKTYEVQE